MSVRFSARFYDGKTSAGVDVVVSLQPDATVLVEGEGIRQRHAAPDVRIAPRIGDTRRSIRFVGGEKCETTDNDAVDALARALGTGAVARLVHAFESRMRLVVGALVALVLLAVAGSIWGIPFAAKQIAVRLPTAVASQIGAGTMDLLDESLFDPSQSDPEDQERLRAAFSAMAERYPELPLRLEFRRMGTLPNAFALPDGTVVVTDRLLDLAETDDQVLAVLAHEIGHVHHRHGLRMALESTSVGLLLSVYVGDATPIATLMSTLPAIYAQASFSRAHETEADTFALEFMTKTGQDPRDLADILAKLQEELGGAEQADGAMAYWSSHPPTAERVARFQQAAHPAPAE